MAEAVAKLAAQEAELRDARSAAQRIRSGTAAGHSGAAQREPLDEGWWLEALDLIMLHSTDSGDGAAKSIKQQLELLDGCGGIGSVQWLRMMHGAA
jgi:hypothetical protein